MWMTFRIKNFVSVMLQHTLPTLAIIPDELLYKGPSFLLGLGKKRFIDLTSINSSSTLQDELVMLIISISVVLCSATSVFT